MTIRPIKGDVQESVPIKTVLVSTFNKDGLDLLVQGIEETCPDVVYLSTGGTYTALEGTLGVENPRLVGIESYTGFPEMEGELVKTLHPVIHAGILGERGNPLHQEYIRRIGQTLRFDRQTGGQVRPEQMPQRIYDTEPGQRFEVEVVEGIPARFIDLVVVNLYPFGEMAENVKEGRIKPGTDRKYDFEDARGNIDIGGPTMMRGAAKNFLGCATLCDALDYASFLTQLKENAGSTDFEQRKALARKVFLTTASYDLAITQFLARHPEDDVRACYTFI